MDSVPAISRVILGSMGLSGFRASDASRIIHCAIDHGISSIDTAPLYGAGRCEELVGHAIAGRRARVQVLTKCGLRWDDDYGVRMFELDVAGEARWVRKDSRPTSIASGIDESLRRLGIETIDLMQIHHLDPHAPLENGLRELERAVDAGKLRAIGISNFPIRESESAHRLLRNGLFSIQDEFSLVSTARSKHLIEYCARSGVRFLAYSPLARGVLSGKYLHAENRHAAADWDAHYTEAGNLARINSVLTDVALPIARRHSASLAQLSLAWALAQPGITSAVAGATDERQVIENAAAAGLAISPENLQRLTQAIAAARLDPSPRKPLGLRLWHAAARARRLCGRALRWLHLR